MANSAPLGGIKKGHFETIEEPMDDWPELRGVNWEDLYPRLRLFAEYRLRGLRWQRGCIPGGLLKLDFVHRAIVKAWDGDRKFDSTKSVCENLCQIIRGDINHQAESYDNRNVSSVDDTTDNLPDGEPSPEDTIHYRRLRDKFLKYLDFDPLARAIAELMGEGLSSHELSIRLQFPISEVENAKKRLRRLCEKFKNEYDESTKRAA